MKLLLILLAVCQGVFADENAKLPEGSLVYHVERRDDVRNYGVTTENDIVFSRIGSGIVQYRFDDKEIVDSEFLRDEAFRFESLSFSRYGKIGIGIVESEIEGKLSSSRQVWLHDAPKYYGKLGKLFELESHLAGISESSRTLLLYEDDEGKRSFRVFSTNGKPVSSRVSLPDTKTEMRLSEDGKLIAFYEFGKKEEDSLRLYSLAEKKDLWSVSVKLQARYLSASAAKLQFSDDGKFVSLQVGTLYDDDETIGHLRVLDVKTGKILLSQKAIDETVFMPGSASLLIREKTKLTVVDIASRKEKALLQTDVPLWSLQLSADKAFLFARFGLEEIARIPLPK